MSYDWIESNERERGVMLCLDMREEEPGRWGSHVGGNDRIATMHSLATTPTFNRQQLVP